MENIPEHLKRHKDVYDRHAAGETYTRIARELKMTPTNARLLALRWERELEKEKYDISISGSSGNEKIYLQVTDAGKTLTLDGDLILLHYLLSAIRVRIYGN